MAKTRIFVVDDEIANLESLERILKGGKSEVQTFQDPYLALKALKKQRVDLLITDLRMNRMSGLELLQQSKKHAPNTEVVLITAFGTVELAVEAMKRGAYDFITKPLQRVQVLKVVERALEKRRLLAENDSLREALRSHCEESGGTIVGNSKHLQNMLRISRQAASSKASVLIEGASGTGKGVLAEYLHKLSSVSSGIFVKINCAAIPDNLLEAELFGYEPGAFTGANRLKKGRVELAHKGTLFLDEIATAPIAFQTKLLRFIQEGEFERLGSNETHRVDTRVISATNCDLKKAVREGVFREDLYYRLNVINIKVPSLSERKEDIPLLIQKFLEDSARKNGRSVPLVHSAALDSLISYSWPGNIRELQNLIECMVVLNQSGVIQKEDLPPEIGQNHRSKAIMIPVGVPLKQVERILMDEALRTAKGDKKQAAKLLGVHPRTIYRHLEQPNGDLSEPEPEVNCLTG